MKSVGIRFRERRIKMEEMIRKRVKTIVEELGKVQEVLDEQELKNFAARIIGARRVVFTAQGRSGFAARTMVCRLMHIGIDVHMAGQPDTPAVEKGDLLVAISSSAGTKITLNHLEAAKKAGADRILITAKNVGADVCENILRIPVRTRVETVQHAGSLFEQSVMIVGDAVCWHVQKTLGTTEEEMNRRHSNLQ